VRARLNEEEIVTGVHANILAGILVNEPDDSLQPSSSFLNLAA
jgi:hypothetical protein